jgi:hypothetical protein
MRPIEDVVKFMNDHAYGVWETSNGKYVGFSVRGFFLQENQLRTLAEYEECSHTGGEPDGLGIAYMAQACLTIAGHPSLNSLDADEGRELFKRFEVWKNSEIEVSQDRLRILVKRLGVFLTRNLMYL